MKHYLKKIRLWLAGILAGRDWWKLCPPDMKMVLSGKENSFAVHWDGDVSDAIFVGAQCALVISKDDKITSDFTT